MLHTLQVELDLDQNNKNYHKNTPKRLTEVFGFALTDNLDNCKVIGGAHGADRETFYFDVVVSEKVFDDCSEYYGIFLENYFGHIPLADYAVKSIRVQDSRVVHQRLQDFLEEFSSNLERRK